MKLNTRIVAVAATAGLVLASLAACGSSGGSGSPAAGDTNATQSSSAGGDTSQGSQSPSSSSMKSPSSSSMKAPSSGSSSGEAGDSSSESSVGGGGDQLAGKTLKFGMVVPETGPSAAIGPYMEDGAKLAASEINADGGVLGAKIKIVAEDGACDAKSATTAANKLISDEVTVSVGGYCSGATLPTLPIFNSAGIPMVIPAANSDDLVNQHLPLVFLVNGTGTQQAQAAMQFIGKEGVKNVALMDDNTSYSVNIADLTEKELKSDSSGAKMAIHDSVTAGENDYTADVNKVLSKKPDFVYWTGYYQEGGLIIKELRQAGYQGKIMVADGSVDKKLIEIAGKKNAQGVFATMTQTPETIPGSKDWIAKYKKMFSSEPGPYSTQSYDAVRVAAKGIENSKSTKGDDIAKGLEAIDGLKLFSGPLKFTKDHTLSSGGFLILVVTGEKFKVKDQLQS
jgi:branched-chain amino acid transport system substrate-binding protein